MNGLYYDHEGAYRHSNAKKKKENKKKGNSNWRDVKIRTLFFGMC